MKPRKITPKKEQEIACLYQEGATGKEIAKMFNVSTIPIYAALERQGIARRPSRSEFSKFSPEIIEEAIRRYRNGELLSDIAKEYSATYQTLARHLLDRGIEKYPNGYQMRAFTPEMDEVIGKRYEDGENLPQLSEVYGINQMTIRRAIMRSGRQTRSKKVALKHYSLNENAFTELSSDSAYWIGFLMADGCIIDRKQNKQSWVIAVSLKSKDRLHLAKLASFLSYDGHIGDSQSRNDASLKVISDTLTTDLMKWGLAVRKSLNEKPNKALLFNPDYWRGEMDGDGSIWIAKGNNPGEYDPAISLVGGEYLITKFAEFVRSFTTTKANPSQNKFGMWRLSLKCKPALDTIRKLYSGCDPAYALDRKLARANRILECWPNGYDGAADHRLWEN